MKPGTAAGARLIAGTIRIGMSGVPTVTGTATTIGTTTETIDSFVEYISTKTRPCAAFFVLLAGQPSVKRYRPAIPRKALVHKLGCEPLFDVGRNVAFLYLLKLELDSACGIAFGIHST